MIKQGSFLSSLGIKKLSQISFGLFSSLFLLWTLFNASSFVPEGQELVFTLAFLGYGILGSYTFAREDVQTILSKISLLKSIPIFLIVAVPSFFIVSYILGIKDLLPQTLFTALIGVPLYLQLINSLVFATVETSFWQGYLDDKVGILGSVLVAGIFHAFIWPGNPLHNFVGASVLFLIFSTFCFFFRKKWGLAVALVATIAFHTAYNLVKYKVVYGV